MSTLEDHEFSHGDGKKTFYHALGPKDGPLMILCHGWPGMGKLWLPQMQVFAGLGFRTVAPDMPGYGRSSARKQLDDYCQENINLGMVELLKQQGRDKAIWIGHDWGCGAVWSFAAHYPEKCIAVAGLCVPYAVLELGLEELLKTVDRNIYPEDEYPWGQWSYQNFYETNFEDASRFFDSDIRAILRALRVKGDPNVVGKPAAITANVSKDGGWLGGIEKPDPSWRHIPVENLVIDEAMFDEFATAMEKTGFWTADAWYAHHARNRKYALEKWKNNGELRMPVLFVHATYDAVCETVTNPKLCANMREKCKNLKEAQIDSSHWMGEEKPAETSAVIARWLVEDVSEIWPKQWFSGKHG